MIVCAKSNLEDVPPDGTRPGQVGKLPPKYGWREVSISDGLINHLNLVQF